MTIRHQIDVTPTMNRDKLPKRPLFFGLFQNSGRKGIFRMLDVDPDAAREPRLDSNPLHDLVYEVKTKRGWRLFRR